MLHWEATSAAVALAEVTGAAGMPGDSPPGAIAVSEVVAMVVVLAATAAAASVAVTVAASVAATEAPGMAVRLALEASLERSQTRASLEDQAASDMVQLRASEELALLFPLR